MKKDYYTRKTEAELHLEKCKIEFQKTIKEMSKLHRRELDQLRKTLNRSTSEETQTNQVEDKEQTNTERMNITNEQFDSPSDVFEHIKDIHCEDSCMVQKRKDNGMPEIEDCPELQDVTIEDIVKTGQMLDKSNDDIMISKERFEELCFMATEHNMFGDFKKSMWYKLYKLFN